jgi:peptide/nickel transport system permease protein
MVMNNSNLHENNRDGGPPLDEELEDLLPVRGFWAIFWLRLRKDRVALAGAAIILALIAMAVAAPYLAPHNPNARFYNAISVDGAPLPPGTNGYVLGTDANGRDLLSRLIWGARVSLLVGIVANAVAVGIGVTLGAVAGYYGGLVGTLIMRFTDVMLAFPVLLLGVALVAILSPGIPVIIMVIGLVSWTSMARIIHGQVVSLRERDFVEAARATGASGAGIVVRHILPHLVSPIIVYSSLGVATAVLFEASLSYLGIGVQPPDASWGKMVAEGSSQGAGGFAYPWLLLFPGAAVFLTVLSFNLLGDGLRDALDPTMPVR